MTNYLPPTTECDLYQITLDRLTTVFSSFSSPSSWSPIETTFLVCLFFSFLTFTVSTITRNYSQVDKLWSITPVIYAWMCALHGDTSTNSARLYLMASIITIWGIRLTFNFYRRGGYQWPPWKGDEDYRWAYIQQGHYVSILNNSFIWCMFNLLFISLYQNLLLWSIVSPSIIVYLVANEPVCVEHYSTNNTIQWVGMDGIATLLILGFILLETIADNQQYTFQTRKYQYLQQQSSNPSDVQSSSSNHCEYNDGFCQSGLFSIVRKPNYAAEQSIWITYFIYSIASISTTTSTNDSFSSSSWGWLWSSYECKNWSFIGWLLLVLLFQGSGKFTEKLSIMKYPKYKLYQERVPLYVPFTKFGRKKMRNSKDDTNNKED